MEVGAELRARSSRVGKLSFRQAGKAEEDARMTGSITMNGTAGRRKRADQLILKGTPEGSGGAELPEPIASVASLSLLRC